MDWELWGIPTYSLRRCHMARREITREFEIENGIITAGSVSVTVTISQGKGPDKVTFIKDMEHTLDYKGVALTDLVDSAASADVVALQNGVWRALGSAVKSEDGGLTSMAEFYNREKTRAPADPAKAVLKAVGNGSMTLEELKALTAMIEQRMANGN
jgi:hypothetical protein